MDITTTDPVLSTESPIHFTLRKLLLVVSAIAVLVAAVSYLDKKSRTEDAESRVPQALSQIHGALNNFISARGEFVNAPELYSWRLRIIMYMERQLYPDWKVAWNVGANQVLAQKAGAGAYALSNDYYEHVTRVLGVVGPDTAFNVQIATPPSQLVIVMEAADSKTHWMQPGDYEVDKLLAATGRLGDTVKGILKDRVHILFADGEVRALSPDMPIDELKPFLTITAAKSADRDKQLAPYRVE